MAERQPALLVLLIEPAHLCWYVGGITASGDALPLLRSEPDSLSDYIGLEFDAQLSYLRHRIAGALQRGCDRLFPRNLKAQHFLLLSDAHFAHASETLSDRLADHFVAWMVNPPVTYLLTPPGFKVCEANDLQIVAGDFPDAIAADLLAGLPKLVAQLNTPDRWEVIAKPQKHA